MERASTNSHMITIYTKVLIIYFGVNILLSCSIEWVISIEPVIY